MAGERRTINHCTEVEDLQARSIGAMRSSHVEAAQPIFFGEIAVRVCDPELLGVPQFVAYKARAPDLAGERLIRTLSDRHPTFHAPKGPGIDLTPQKEQLKLKKRINGVRLVRANRFLHS